MKSTILFGVLAALATGVAIGTQSTISSRIGAVIGPFRTGMLVNFVGGTWPGYCCWDLPPSRGEVYGAFLPR
jgi:drug/metabolite transporter (DMT)-like permease